MVVYEVNIDVEQSVVQEFVPWLKQHIQEMLKIPGFITAHLLREIKTNKYSFSVHYFVENNELLDQYLNKIAPKMRKESQNRFGDTLSFHRRIFHLKEQWPVRELEHEPV